MNLLRSLIRESLLLEKVYGAQATVYHGTKANPLALIDALLKDEFMPGIGAGSMYGKGLYTVYDISGTKTAAGDYGDHVIKLKVNLYGYIIFDPDVAKKVYKRTLTPAEQAEEVGYSKTVVDVLVGVKQPQGEYFTSDLAFSVYKKLQNEVKGLVFTGKNDGRVVVIYDPTTAVPMAWKNVNEDYDAWMRVDKTKLFVPLYRPDVSSREGRPVQQSALRRSAMGDFEAGKWDSLALLKRLERLPEDRRVVRVDLDLSDEPVTSLPQGLKVRGSLNLSNTKITTLPQSLQVDDNLLIVNTPITSLPANLKVGGSFLLQNTHITFLPAGLEVGKNLTLWRTPITSLPADLKVGGSFTLRNAKVTALPAGLKIVGNFELWETPVAALPAGLEIGGYLDIYKTPITSLPDDLQVGGIIYGIDSKYLNNVPDHLKGKLR